MQMDVVVAPTEGHNRMTRGTLGWEGGSGDDTGQEEEE